MAIRLGYAIGLGGKRESVIKDLGEGIGEIAKGLSDAKKADAAQRLKAQQDAKAAIPEFNVPKVEMLKSDMDELIKYAERSYIELNNDVAQGKSSSYIEDKGIKRKNEMMRLANQAAQDYKISVELGTLKNNEKQNFYMDDADKKFLEHISKPISEREDAQQFRAKVLDSLIPVKGSMVEAIKTTHSEFQPEKDFWMERTVEGTNKILPVEENQVKQRGFYIEQAKRDPSYMKNVGYRAMQMLKGVQFKDEGDANEQMQFAIDKVINSDYDDMVRESRPRDLKINLTGETGYGGGGGFTVNGVRTFITQPTQAKGGNVDQEAKDLRAKIAGLKASMAAYEKQIGEAKQPDAKAMISEEATKKKEEIKAAESRLVELEGQKIANARNQNIMVNISSDKGSGIGQEFLSSSGERLKNVSLNNIIIDPETGEIKGILANQTVEEKGNKKTTKEIILPANSYNIKMVDKIKKNTISKHIGGYANRGDIPKSSVDYLNRLLSEKPVSLKGGDKKEARAKKTKGGITFTVR